MTTFAKTPPANSRPARITSLWFCRFLTLLILTLAAQAAPKWGPINKEELAEQTPKVDPDAGAEIILRETRMLRTHGHTAYDRHYVRIKIFNQKGVEDFKKIDIAYFKGTIVRDVEARTIEPDGSVRELDHKDVFKRVGIKFGVFHQNVISFAPPDIEPGTIIEYRYRVETEFPGGFTPMLFQSPHPERIVRYLLEPIRDLHIRTVNFNCPEQQLKPDQNGNYTFEMRNLPAAEDELFATPILENLKCILLYYYRSKKTPDENWKLIGDDLSTHYNSAAKATKTIRTTLGEIVKPNDSDLEKLNKIYDFCRSKIINRDSKTSGLTKQQLEDLRKNPHAAATLKVGSGTRIDINILFAALARAAGMDARPIICSDRTNLRFNANLPELQPLLLGDEAVAIRLQSEWHFFNPGARYLPFGMLPWKNSGTTALICGKKNTSEFISISGELAEKSKLERKGTLSLNVDGTLEGDVTEIYSGYRESDLKCEFEDKTPAELEAHVTEAIQKHQKLAEVTAIDVENATDPLRTLKISYHLRIPVYAHRTGTRMVFQPAVFQNGHPPLFEASTRRSDICFQYRHITHDDLRITPPKSYDLEEASAPKDLDLGPLGSYTVNIGIHRKTHDIVFQRQLSLNGLSFDKKDYDAIKSAFETLHKADSHLLTLNRAELSNTASTASTPPVIQSAKHD